MSTVAAASMPVRLDKRVHKLIKEYSEMTKEPMSRVIENALITWMEDVGAARIEALKTKGDRIDNLRSVIQFPN